MFSNVCSLIVFLFLNVEINSQNVFDRSNNNVKRDGSVLNFRISIEKLQKMTMTDFSFECPFTEHWELIGDRCPAIHEPESSAIYVRRIARRSVESDDEIKLGTGCYVQIESRKCHPRLSNKEEGAVSAVGETGFVGAENRPPPVRSKRQAFKRNEVVGYFQNRDAFDYEAQEQDAASSTSSDSSSAAQDSSEATSEDTSATIAASGDEVAPSEATAPPESATSDDAAPAADDTKEESGGDDAAVVTTAVVETPPPTEPAESDEVEKTGDDGGRGSTKSPGGGRIRRTSIIFIIVGVLLAIVFLIAATIMLMVVRRRKRRRLQASIAARSAKK